ncbi:IS21-like element helper ATPase IstB [Endozoicomonas gorgoniicola]|uniref:IS21-like element helper ATPase IstB n=1 Tax=Endozoicomonas gorgoniicola TaxID=1234144 RepID=A0ABT3MUW8_9GAMM|nr:IS21-like element helper ATPase IstB [Endozoicomonas gorgoniicola]MCW7552779.1 IS21-like element helper ATPase IstB [Endozoicomonas gorgoniicola]MCW7552875.1 IS21-like element helper ATPase IstB [Endozoicomonas gorgoniicola]MCW7554520.1 IS21-like element helper ATPase IstB [Endozoicomonas gorgoniicola]
MLMNPTMEKLQVLKLTGMLEALDEQLKSPDIEQLSFDERLGLMIDREMTARDNRRLKTRLKKARLRHDACMEDIDYRHPRGLKRDQIQQLLSSHWIREHQNVIITGPTGVGKTWLACAMAQKACRDGYTVQYLRLPRLLQDLNLARADGRYVKLMTALAKTDLLLLDDWGLSPLTESQRRDLLEIVEDRHNVKSTLVTSQMPVDHWHELIGDPTLADAILDRLIHNAHRVPLKGDSLRKKQSKLAKSELTS